MIENPDLKLEFDKIYDLAVTDGKLFVPKGSVGPSVFYNPVEIKRRAWKSASNGKCYFYLHRG